MASYLTKCELAPWWQHACGEGISRLSCMYKPCRPSSSACACSTTECPCSWDMDRPGTWKLHLILPCRLETTLLRRSPACPAMLPLPCWWLWGAQWFQVMATLWFFTAEVSFARTCRPNARLGGKPDTSTSTSMPWCPRFIVTLPLGPCVRPWEESKSAVSMLFSFACVCRCSFVKQEEIHDDFEAGGDVIFLHVGPVCYVLCLVFPHVSRVQLFVGYSFFETSSVLFCNGDSTLVCAASDLCNHKCSHLVGKEEATKAACQQHLLGVQPLPCPTMYALSARSTDGGFYCAGCWEEKKIHASTHSKMVHYPPCNLHCAVCQQLTSRLLLPELCTYQHTNIPPQWTCDACYEGLSKAVLYHHLQMLASVELPLPLTSLHDVDIYVTDFCFPKKGDAAAMQMFLASRLQSCYPRLHIIDGVDATAPDLVEAHCHGYVPTVILWGSPHINVLADQKPSNQIQQEAGMRNCEWKLEAFRWLAERYPSSLILCPLQGVWKILFAICSVSDFDYWKCAMAMNLHFHISVRNIIARRCLDLERLKNAKGRPSKISVCQALDAIFFVCKAGCSWACV